jgi:hypothetical protein
MKKVTTALGGEIWAHGKVLLNHIGHYEFVGDLSKMPQFGPAGDQPQLDVNAPAALADAIKMAQKAPA